MNKRRTFLEKSEFLRVHLSKTKSLINLWWIVGFIDGEGCFYFYIGKQTKTTIQLQASLEIAQNTHDILVLEKIKEYLGCGRIKSKDENGSKSNISRLIISNPIDIKTKIIPIFDSYTLRTEKLLDYEDWKKLIDMKYKKLQRMEMRTVSSN